MPAISEQDALAVAAGLPHLKPEEQQEATRLLQRYQHQQEHERGEALFPSIEEQRKKDREAFYGIFADPKKVEFGNPLLSSALPYLRDQDTARKREASVRFLQDRYQRDEQEIRESLPLYMASYAFEKWDEPSLTDPARFFDFAKTEIEDEQATNLQMDDAAKAGARAGLSSTPRLQAFREWQALAQGKPGYSAQAGRVFSAAYEMYGSTVRRHKRLLDDAMGAIQRAQNVASEPEDEDRLRSMFYVVADMPPKDRRIVTQALFLRGKAHGEKTVKPGVGGFMQQTGESAGRLLIDMYTKPLGTEIEQYMRRIPEAGTFSTDIPFLDSVDTAVSFLNEQALLAKHRQFKPRFPEPEKQYSRELSDAERVALKSAQQLMERHFRFAREVKAIGRMADPVENVYASTIGSSLGLIAGGVVGSAHPALWGSTLLMAQIGYANMEYEDLRLKYEDMDVQTAGEIANITGAVVAFGDKLGFSMLRRLPSLRAIVDGGVKKELLKRAGIQLTGVYAAENLIEGGQDITGPVVHSIVKALKTDASIPGVDWDEENRLWWKARPDVALGMIPLTLIGVGFATVADVANAQQILQDNLELGRAGINEADRVVIMEHAANGRMEEAQIALQEAWKRRDPDTAEQFQSEADAQQERVRQVLNDAERIGLIPRFTRNGRGYLVETKDGSAVQVADWNEARQIAEGHMTDAELAEADTIARMGEHFISQKRGGEAETFTIDKSQAPVIESRGDKGSDHLVPTIRDTAQGQADLVWQDGSVMRFADRATADSARWDFLEKQGLSFDEGAREAVRQKDTDLNAAEPQLPDIDAAVEATIVAGQLAGLTREQAENETWHILGKNDVEQKDSVARLASTVFREGNVLTAIHEPVEARWKSGLESGRYSQEQGLLWIRMAEKATGLSLLPMTDAEVLAPDGSGMKALTEAISDAVVSDSLSRRKDGTRLPAGLITEGLIATIRRTTGANQGEAVKFRHFLKAFRTLFGQVFAKARALAKARARGQLGEDYESFLQDLMGADSQVRHERAVAQESTALADRAIGEAAPKLGESFSLRAGEIQRKLENLFNPINKDPALRRRLSQEGQRRLNAVRRSMEREIVTKGGHLVLRTSEGLDALTERNRTRSNIEVEARFRQAQALERILKGKGLDTKDATRSKDSKDYERLQRYQESRHLLMEGGMTEEQAEPLARASAAKWRDNLVQNVKASIAEAKKEAAAWRRKELAKVPTDRELISGWLRTLDAVYSVLPAEVRGQLGGHTQMSEKATDEARLKEMVRRVGMMDKALESYLRKDLTGRITELLEEKAAPGKTDRGVTQSKLTPDAQRYLTEARRVWQMSKEDVEARMQALDQQLQSATDPQAYSELLSHWDAAARFGALAAKDAESLSSALDALESIYREGRNERAAQDAARKKQVKGWIAASLENLNSPNGATDVDLAERAVKDQQWLSRLLSQTKGVVSENVLAFEHQMGRIFGHDSTITREFTDKLRKAHNLHQGLMLEMEREYHGLLSQLTGTTPNTFRATRAAVKLIRGLRLLQEKTGIVVNFTRETASRVIDRDFAKLIADDFDAAEDLGYSSAEAKAIVEAYHDPDNAKRDLIPFSFVENAGEPREMPMSHMNAAHYILTWNQEAGREQMERDGWTEENLEQVRNFIDPRALQLMRWIAEKYQVTGYNLANPVYRRMFHMDMPRTKNYAPLRRKVNGEDQTLSIEEMEMTKASAVPGLLIGRVTSRAPIARVDALTVFWQHWNALSYWAAFGETIRDMQAVFRNLELQEAILVKHGEEKMKGLSNRIEEARTGGAGTAYTLGAIDRLAQNITKGRVFSALVGNIGTLMKQTPALFNHFLATDLSNGAIIRGWGKLMTGQLDVQAMWKNPAIQRRLQGRFTAEQRAAMSRPGESPNLLLTLMEKGLLPIRYTDASWNLAGAAIAWDHYKGEAVRNGMSEAEAEAFANDSVDRMLYNTAQPDAQAARGMISNQRNAFLPFVWLFNTEPMQKAGIEYMVWRRVFAGKATSVDARQLFTLHVLQPLTLWGMSGLYRYFLGDDDAEDAWDWRDLLVGMTLGPASGLVFFGDALSSMLRRLVGAKTWASSANPLLAAAARGNTWEALYEFAKSFFPEAAALDVLQRLAEDGISAIENGADLIEDGEKQ